MKFGSHVSDSTSVKNRLINDYVRVGLLSENKMSIRISRQELASSLRIEGHLEAVSFPLLVLYGSLKL